MAKLVFMGNVVLLIVLVVSREVLPIEGRQYYLRSIKEKGCKKCVVTTSHIDEGHTVSDATTEYSIQSSKSSSAHDLPNLIKQEEGYRPTTPGHSPGIGHEYLKSLREKGCKKCAVTTSHIEEGHTVSDATMEYSIQKSKSSSDHDLPNLIKQEEGYRPTTPGNSHGIGHTVKNEVRS